MAFSAQGTTFTFADDSDDPVTVGGIMGYSGFDGEAPDIEETTFDDLSFKVFTQGLADAGGFNLEVFRDPDDAGQAEIWSACNALATRECVLTFVEWGTVTFNAYVKSVPIAGGIDERAKGTIKFKVTGEPDWEEFP